MSSRRSLYIVGPIYDWLLFLLQPTFALWIGIVIAHSAFTDDFFAFRGAETTASQLVIATIIHAHLVAVVFRSHANQDVFRQHRFRFVVVPIVLWLAIVASTWVAITATVLATFWDVYHSGAQTFGFARIYDRNAGVPADVARKLDKWVNQLLYAGPILAGATMLDHVNAFQAYDNIGDTFFTAVPAYASKHQRYMTWTVLIGGIAFLSYYVFAHIQLYRKGYRFSPLKIFLVTSTGLCSIYTWGFNSWGEAFFIMNLFHAIQYLALVWAVEHKHIVGMLHLSGRRGGNTIALTTFLSCVFAYGIGVQLVHPSVTTVWAITVVVSLMHFWYDGFVWSVRKSQI